MYKENENCSTKTEEAIVEHVNQGSKLNTRAYLSSSTKPVTSDQLINNGDDENSLMRENSKEENTMFQENQNCSMETEATSTLDLNIINGIVATCDFPVTTSQHSSACDEEIENSLMRENSDNEATLSETKLYNKIKNRVKDFTTDNKQRVVRLWYQIGEDIDKYYEVDYGKNEMKRISDNTRIGISTLYKAVQFAKNFNDDDIERLLAKDYISFRLIVESFPIGKVRALQVFESSSNAKEAQRKINEIKLQESDKGTTSDDGNKSKSLDSETVLDSEITSGTVPEESGTKTYLDKIDENQAAKLEQDSPSEAGSPNETTKPSTDAAEKTAPETAGATPITGFAGSLINKLRNPKSGSEEDEPQGTPAEDLSDAEENPEEKIPDIKDMFPHLDPKTSIAAKKTRVVELGNDLIRIGQEALDSVKLSTGIEWIITELMALFSNDSVEIKTLNTLKVNNG